ncbi:hypothetical protein N656DRAFT_797266 [Canariomyces notabilis]|uniref:WW domain-containing protein n=1 Tax=Canariomyces notabilis TaxID=2074819 RepID=A0AAN6YT68_9PEZI|nr:hypothetical protein N656DRAFT_797266 [Canariomyces arenarius]
MASADPPPSYEEAIGDRPLPQQARNGIPLRARRSMEDELRPLPPGWVREFDPETQHQFFVDTKTSPPRSIWHHPYDDETFLNSLPPTEREQIRASQSGLFQRRPSAADLVAEQTDEDGSDSDTHTHTHAHTHRTIKLGRKLKDHLTGTTHEERVAERTRRAHAERELYRQHCVVRRAMIDGMRTGRPQLLGRDENRVHMYLEPPGHTFPGVAGVSRISPYLLEIRYNDADGRRPGPPGRYFRPEGDMYGLGYGAYGCGRFAGGRWDRPQGEYRRLDGRGFGGGLGMPLMAPLLGGMMLGGLAGTAF